MDTEKESSKLSSVDEEKMDVDERESNEEPEVAGSAENPTKLQEVKKNKAKIKKCVNLDCSRESAEFIESPLFIQRFYLSYIKPDKSQFVCTLCFEKAILKYEEHGTAMMNNLPMFNVKVPKKNETIVINDSDDEDEQTDAEIPDNEKIIFNQEVESEIEEILQNFCNKIDFKKQLAWDEENIKKRLDRIDFQQSFFDEESKEYEKYVAIMHQELYSINKPNILQWPSLDINDEFDPEPPHQPPASAASSPVALPSIPSAAPFALKSNIERRMQNWLPCNLLEKIPQNDGNFSYRVQFFDSSSKIVSGKEFALSIINLNLTVGTRVIALFSTLPTQKKVSHKKFMPGVIAERRAKYNRYRYLVFCDYGYSQYFTAEEVRAVAESSPNVVDDVHQNLKVFLQYYLETQGKRPMVNVQVNQQISTERNKIWRKAQVMEIDCSMVCLFFPEENVSEWIYRGSKRFEQIFELDTINNTGVDFDEEEQHQEHQEASPEVFPDDVIRDS